MRETEGHPREALGSEGLHGDCDVGTSEPPLSPWEIPPESDSPKARVLSVLGTMTDSQTHLTLPLCTRT